MVNTPYELFSCKKSKWHTLVKLILYLFKFHEVYSEMYHEGQMSTIISPVLRRWYFNFSNELLKKQKPYKNSVNIIPTGDSGGSSERAIFLEDEGSLPTSFPHHHPGRAILKCPWRAVHHPLTQNNSGERLTSAFLSRKQHLFTKDNAPFELFLEGT